jgi:RHS repeat-associated protein
MSGGEAWTYDGQDRLLSAPGISYAYRNDGTATSKITPAGTYGYVYDLSGFLQAVNLPSGGTVQYTADARNRRIAKSFTSGSTTISQQFVYDSQVRVAAELSNNGAAITSVFVYGAKRNVPDYIISVKNGGKVYRIVSDWLGSVRLVLDTTTTPATVVQQLDYDEFGNVLPSSFDSTCAPNVQCFPFQPFGFAGGIQDRETGLVRFGARDYDPQVGRWVSKDPIRFAGADTNLYAYCHNDPLNCSDPSGLDPLSSFTQGFIDGAVGALIVGGAVVLVATLGVPAAVIGGVLAVGTVVGAGSLSYEVAYGAIYGDWDPLAYSAGSLLGGAIAGAGTGSLVAEGLNGVPSPPWSIASDLGQVYNPNWVDPVTGGPGSIGQWWGSGLNPGSTAALTAGTTVAVVSICGGP